jgi:hypothetical protein
MELEPWPDPEVADARRIGAARDDRPWSSAIRAADRSATSGPFASRMAGPSKYGPIWTEYAMPSALIRAIVSAEPVLRWAIAGVEVGRRRGAPATLVGQMVRYYVWALGENVLSYLPGGQAFYRAVGRAVKRKGQGRSESFVTALPVTRKASELAPAGGRIMEVGTGWHHHDAFLLYLVGDYEVVLFDVADKAWLPYIHNYIETLLSHSSFLATELGIEEGAVRRKLEPLISLHSREDIYRACNFVPCIVDDPTVPFFERESVDFMVSNCTLNHIPPDVLIPELSALRAILKEGGQMYHHLGHDDHWAFHDPAVGWPSFNYMRYSDRTWRWFFETKLEYHNRLVKPEWIQIFGASGFQIIEYDGYVTDESRAAVRGLPRIDPRFARHDEEDLAHIYSYVLARKRPNESVDDPPIRVGRVTPPSP